MKALDALRGLCIWCKVGQVECGKVWGTIYSTRGHISSYEAENNCLQQCLNLFYLKAITQFSHVKEKNRSNEVVCYHSNLYKMYYCQ